MSDEADRPQGTASASGDELLRPILESATDFAIFTMDPEGRVTSWNTGAQRVLGYREDEILGQSADIMFPPVDAQAGAEERQRALEHGRAEDERWQMRNDGTRFWASGLMMPLADRRLGFVKILRDWTERHFAQERLRESEERFRLLATNIPQLVFRCRSNGDRTWGSPQWIAFTGLGLDESLRFGWLDAIHPDDREATLAAWRAAEQRGEYYIEHRIRRLSDGEYRWHQTRAMPIQATGEAADEWVGTSSDIHDLRTLQGRQQVLLAELQHRTRNLLAVVQSIERQTLRSSTSLEAFGDEFESRLRALSRVQSLLARTDNRATPLRELVEAELAAHGDGANASGKLRVDGPPVAVPPTAAQVLALAIMNSPRTRSSTAPSANPPASSR